MAGGDATSVIERNAAGADRGLVNRRNTPRDSADASEKDLENKRFDEVVVSAEVEGMKNLGDRVDGSQHQNRHLAASVTDSLENLKAVHLRQKNVEQGDVVFAGEDHIGAFATVMGERDAVAVFSQGAFDQIGDPLVVFNDQHVHLEPLLSRLQSYVGLQCENQVTGQNRLGAGARYVARVSPTADRTPARAGSHRSAFPDVAAGIPSRRENIADRRSDSAGESRPLALEPGADRGGSGIAGEALK